MALETPGPADLILSASGLTSYSAAGKRALWYGEKGKGRRVLRCRGVIEFEVWGRKEFKVISDPARCTNMVCRFSASVLNFDAK